MRYTKGAPNTLYVVLDMARGDVICSVTNLKEARQIVQEELVDPFYEAGTLKIFTYDQRVK